MAVNWLELALGIWILVSPWLLGYSSISVMKWSNIIAGTILILVNVWVIFGGEREKVAAPSDKR